MAKETFEFNQIFAGEVNYITRVKVAAGPYKRGDLLENVITGDAAAAVWGQCAVAATATMANAYAVCANDCDVLDGDEVAVYKEGHFNRALIMLNGEAADEDSVEVLRIKNIFLENVGEQ